MTKQRCIKLYLNNTFDDKNFKIKGLNIIDGKDTVGFLPICKFLENKPRGRFWRGRKTLILFVDDALQALKFGEPTDEMQLAWGKSEAREFVFKLNALAEVALKPIKTWQFAVIMIFLMILTIIGIANLQRLGAF